MRRVDGEEDSVLTRGDLSGTPSTLGNLAQEGKLNRQKSAEVIVAGKTEIASEGLNMKESERLCVQTFAMTADNLRACLEEEAVNPAGDFRRAEQTSGTSRPFRSREECIKDDGAISVTGELNNSPKEGGSE